MPLFSKSSVPLTLFFPRISHPLEVSFSPDTPRQLTTPGAPRAGEKRRTKMFPRVFARVRGLTIALLLTAAPALPCSICRCGDSTFNSLGPNVFAEGKFHIALDWDRFEKDSAVAPEDTVAALRRRLSTDPASTGFSQVVENRFTATAAYTFGESVVAVARIPFSQRHLVETDFASGSVDDASTNALSDPEFYALVRVWASPFRPGLGRNAWVSVIGGVKTPWGKNDLSSGGVRLDEHLQAGTGSTDFFAGLSVVYLLDPHSSVFGSAQYRVSGTNDFEHRYGNITLVNAAYERKLGKLVDAVVELDYRHAERDHENASSIDPNTGGDIVYVSPRLVIDLGRGLAGRAAVQIPLIRALYGDQTERVVASLGLTYLF